MLKNKDFMIFLSSKVLSTFSTSAVLIAALKWVEMTSHSKEVLSWFFVFYTLPFIFFSIAIGTFIQNKKKKNVIRWANVTRAFLAILFLIFMDVIPYYFGIIYMILDSIPYLFILPSERSLLTKLVDKESLIKANTLLNFTDLLPALAGAMGTATLLRNGVPVHYIFIAVIISWFLSAIILSNIKFKESVIEVKQSLKNYFMKMKSDLIYVKNEKKLVLLFFFFGVFWIVYAPIQDVIGVHYLTNVLHKGSEELGYFNSMFRVGNMISLLFIPFLYRNFERKWFIFLPFLIYGIYISFIAFNAVYLYILLFNVLIGVFANVLFIFFINYLQETVPDERQGSIFGFHGMMVQGLKGPATLFFTLSIVPVGFTNVLGSVSIYLVLFAIMGLLIFPSIGKGKK